MSSSDDHRDPTAPPPLPDSTEPSPAPGPDDTQVVGPEATRPFTPPAPPAPPSYEQPTYSTPSYDLPAYGAPQQDAPPATDPHATPAQNPYGAPPAPPVDPYGAPSASGAYPPPPTPGASVPSYGQSAPSGQSAPYGPAAPYGSAPAYGPGSPYAAPRNNTSALVLTIVSGLTTVITIGFCVGIVFVPALVFGIIGLTKQSSDPESSRKMSRWGWISFGVAIGLGVLAIVGIVVLAGTNGAFTGT